MGDNEGLHGQALSFNGVAPLAGSGANDAQCVQENSRGDVAASHLRQLS